MAVTRSPSAPAAPASQAADSCGGPGGKTIAASSSTNSLKYVFSGRLSPADQVVIGYLSVVAFLVAISSHRIPDWWVYISLHVLAIAAVAAAALYLPPRPAWSFTRAWYPVALVPVTFKELEYLVPLVNPRDLDSALVEIDYWMFGTHPTVWLEQFVWPPLTELLQLSYMAYYFMPVILGVALWRNRQFGRFYFFVFVAVLGFYLSYLGYFLVPSIGPRFVLADLQTRPLEGVWLYEGIRSTLDWAEGITRDCFPSGHTLITIFVLWYGRYHRPTFRVLLLPGSALIVSTVYLRYHYVIDVIAGIILAAVIVIVAPALYRVLGGFDSHCN